MIWYYEITSIEYQTLYDNLVLSVESHGIITQFLFVILQSARLSFLGKPMWIADVKTFLNDAWIYRNEYWYWYHAWFLFDIISL